MMWSGRLNKYEYMCVCMGLLVRWWQSRLCIVRRRDTGQNQSDQIHPGKQPGANHPIQTGGKTQPSSTYPLKLNVNYIHHALCLLCVCVCVFRPQTRSSPLTSTSTACCSSTPLWRVRQLWWKKPGLLLKSSRAR